VTIPAVLPEVYGPRVVLHLEGFREPVAVLSAGRIWRRADVEAWARATGRLP
jgi:hypothetical protein